MDQAWVAALGAWDTSASIANDALTKASPYFQALMDFLGNPWARAVGLTLIVYLTVRVIASVYSGDRQNSELGPVGIRTHTAQRLDRKTIVLPRRLMPMNMDGVSATLKIFYAYTDSRGKPCKQLLHTIQHCRLAVSPSNLSRVASTVYGHEVPDVATNDVCFPSSELDGAPDELPATPERARDYAALHNIVESWREDDDALLVSLHAEQHEEVVDLRHQYIVGAAHRVAAAREGNFLHRLLNGGAARRRPNVIGSYYIKFEFSHDPMFVLTRHPDRELKMTAWLTVLTSMFALVMEAWPARTSASRAPAQIERSFTRTPHIPVQP